MANPASNNGDAADAVVAVNTEPPPALVATEKKIKEKTIKASKCPFQLSIKHLCSPHVP